MSSASPDWSRAFDDPIPVPDGRVLWVRGQPTNIFADACVLKHPNTLYVRARNAEGCSMPERNFRYVSPDHVEAWKAAGWRVIGMTRSPHDGKLAVIVEWPTPGGLMEPSQNGDRQISVDL